MPVGIEGANFSSTYVSGRESLPGTRNLTVIAPRDPLATIAANIIVKYSNSDAVRNQQGLNSLLHKSSILTLQNLTRVRSGAFASEAQVAVGQRTFGSGVSLGTGTLPSAALPLSAVSSVSVDGVPYTNIEYTNKVPNAGNFPSISPTTIVVNPKTGVFYSATVTSGAGAGIVFGNIDTPSLALIKAQILTQPVEIVTFAGWRYNAQYWAMWDDLVAWAATENLMVAAAADDSVAPDDPDFVSLVQSIRSDNFAIVAAKLVTPTDDLTSAYAAMQTNSAPNGTRNKQNPPKGLAFSRDLPYTRDDYGDGIDPAVGTFHYIGVNAIALSGGAFQCTDDRCMTDYSAATDALFFGVRRTLNATNGLVGFAINTFLTASPTSAIYDQDGLSAIRAVITGGLLQAAIVKYIDRENFTAIVPDLEDIPDVDRKKRVLNNVQLIYRLAGIVHVVNFSVEVSQ